MPAAVYVLSVEGEHHRDSTTEASHEILGIYRSRQDAEEAIPHEYDDRDLVLITELPSGTVTRLVLHR